MVEVNKINEIYSGHYQVILDFPSPGVLNNILDSSYNYVWGFQHNEIRSSWEKYEYTLFGQKGFEKGFARNVQMEFLIDTKSFLKLIPNIKQTVHLVQTNVLPPHYVDLNRLSGQKKYALLKDKVDYLLEIEIPGAADYAPLVSPNLSYLEMLIERLNKGDRK